MGVSIMLGEQSITPGWRSAMYQLMLDNFGRHYERDAVVFVFRGPHVDELQAIRDQQYRGVKEPPFDWSQEIADSFDKIIAEIKTRGEAVVSCYN